jgi:hypothetical protein
MYYDVQEDSLSTFPSTFRIDEVKLVNSSEFKGSNWTIVEQMNRTEGDWSIVYDGSTYWNVGSLYDTCTGCSAATAIPLLQYNSTLRNYEVSYRMEEIRDTRNNYQGLWNINRWNCNGVDSSGSIGCNQDSNDLYYQWQRNNASVGQPNTGSVEFGRRNNEGAAPGVINGTSMGTDAVNATYSDPKDVKIDKDANTKQLMDPKYTTIVQKT